MLAVGLAVITLAAAPAFAAPPWTPINTSCAVDPSIANLNELKFKGGGPDPNAEFIEIMILKNNVNIAGWKVCYSDKPNSEKCVNLGTGAGKWYTTSQTTGIADNNGPDGGNPTTYQATTWLVYQTNNMDGGTGEVALFDGSGKVLDYIRYSNSAGACSNNDKRWNVSASCGACFDGRATDEKDFARLPDGTGPWVNNLDTPTEGGGNTSNTGAAGFAIDIGAGTASTCTAREINITVLDAGGNPITGHAGTVSLTTSSAHGDWSKTGGSPSSDPALGTLTNGTADDGIATYAFDPADLGTVALFLSNVHADDLTITVTDTANGAFLTSLTLSFRDNAFVITPTGPLGAEVVAARNHAMQAALWRKDPSTGFCAIATGYGGSKALKAWRSLNVDDPGGTAPTVAATTLPSAVPGANNLTLSFTSGVAAFNLTTTDVGKYVLNLRDDTSGFAKDIAGNPLTINGSSGTLTVRPFALAISNIIAGATPNPGANTPGGAIFTTAGSNFAATMTAVRWQAADDADNNGLPDTGANLADNAATAAYKWASTFSAATPFTPATGVLGSVNNGAIAMGAFASGAATASSLQYTEVGSFSLGANAANFLNTAGIGVTSLPVVTGRFTPAGFAVAANTPQFATACAAGGFTYIGQPFMYATAPVLTATAKNALGATTTNYTGTWMKLTNASVGSPIYTAASGTLDTGGLPSPDPVIAGAGGGNVTLTFGAGTGLAFNRAAEVAPFDADIALAINIVDTDAVAYSGNPATIGAATPGNGIAFNSGKSMRFGRVALDNTVGSELLPLSMPLRISYWADEDADTVYSFTTHTADSCTSLVSGNFSLGNYTGNLSSGETAITGVTLAAGSGGVTLSAPNAGNEGSVDVTGNVPTWLRYDWDGNGSDDNPVARATFGLYRGEDEQIHFRELY